ncbi:hypothetical protein BD626DRAFT_487678 [Schizophyllum amplum]|uniref:Uncharacterized protein n=1 Tax=Schizophyllum amplum TaxID=97359 RepID=A0A550CNL2_9AGAR|nr:hypothetical protein BD626DRAFT_487678 [Auriculariopsis ampla]
MDFSGQKFALGGGPANGFDLDPSLDRAAPQLTNGMGNQQHMQMLRMQGMQGSMGPPSQQWGTGQPMMPQGNPMNPHLRAQQHPPPQQHPQGFAPQNQQWNDMRHRQQMNPGMPGMNNFGAMNGMGFGISPALIQHAHAMSAPIDRSEEDIIVHTLIQGLNAGVSYKEALNSLHGKRNHSASLWKDYYLDHKHRLDRVIEARITPRPSMSAEPPSAPAVMKRQPVKEEPSPEPSSASAKRTQARARHESASSRPSPRQTSSVPPAKKSRRTFNSITGPEAVFDERLPPPHADLKTPEPPSRSPTPPTLIVAAGRGNKFTPQDRDFFLKFISWRLKENPTLTRGELCDALAQKAPHHSSQSWASYWSNHHDLPDKILASAKEGLSEEEDDASGEEDGGATETSEEVIPQPTPRRRRAAARAARRTSSSEEPASRRRRQPRRAPSSESPLSEAEDSEQDGEGEPDDEEDTESAAIEDVEIRNWKASDMGTSGGPFTDADYGIVATHIASFVNFKQVTHAEKWGGFHERYPMRSAKAWAEYYRRNEKGLDRLAKVIRKRQQSGKGATHSASREESVKRQHSPDADDDDDEIARKRGRTDED